MYENITLIIGMAMAIFYLTTLYGRKSPFYSFASTLMLGITLAYLGVYTIKAIYTDSFLQILGGNYVQIIPFILGLLMLTSASKKYRYLAKIPTCITTGALLALTTRSVVFTQLIGFVRSAILPLFTPGDWYHTLQNVSTVVFSATILIFFIYTTPRKGIVKGPAMIGEYALFIALGSFVANSFMSYLGRFTGIMKGYVTPNSNAITFITMGIVVLGLMIYLDKKNLLEKYAE